MGASLLAVAKYIYYGLEKLSGIHYMDFLCHFFNFKMIIFDIFGILFVRSS